VTLRDRDSTLQRRVKADELFGVLGKEIDGI
jgi:glycyl-tRNA synthetase (class II)